MHILYYFNDYPTPMYRWQRAHIVDELKRRGIEVEILSPARQESIDAANEALLKRLRAGGVDLFMTPHTDRELYPEALRAVRALGVPTMLICFDDLVLPFAHDAIAPLFDLVWLTSRETQPHFEATGCNTIFLPYAANPYLERCERETVAGVGFVGTPYGSRANMIAALTESGVDVYCHYRRDEAAPAEPVSGPPPASRADTLRAAKNLARFPEGRRILLGAVKNKLLRASLPESERLHAESVVPPERLYTVYGRYALALSSTATRNTGVLKRPLDIVNLRSFEIPMAGGVLLCRYTPELAGYFEPGREALYYRDDAELAAMAREWLSDARAADRAAIRAAARERAVREHTWYNRFTAAFHALGLSDSH